MGSTFYTYDEPEENNVLKDFKPRLPRYMTPDALKNMGFSSDMISALYKQCTPIAYQDADRRNWKEKARREFNNPGSTHIPSYMQASYIIKGELNPEGSDPLLQVHRSKIPTSDWHASKEQLQQMFKELPDSTITVKVNVKAKDILDLSIEPRYVSQAKSKPYYRPLDKHTRVQAVMIEISFNRVGTQQAFIDNEKMQYDDTVPIEEMEKHLKPKGP